MHFKNLILAVFLILTLFGSQSMSNCNPEPAPEPGLMNIQVSTIDTNNVPLPNTLVGLFAASDQNDIPFRTFTGCLIDTFYTDNSGYKEIGYHSGHYNYYWIAVLPDDHLGAIIEVRDHKIDTSLVVYPTQPLLAVNVNIANFDSVIVQSRDLRMGYDCSETTPQQNLLLHLNHKKATANTQFLFDVAPNSLSKIQVLNYTDGELATDSIIEITINDTLMNVQIN